MNLPLKTLLLTAAVILTVLAPLPLRADQSLGQTAPEDRDPGVFGKASRSIGGFFHRLFNGGDDQSSAPRGPAPRRRTDERASLDLPPPLPGAPHGEPAVRKEKEKAPDKQGIAASHKSTKPAVEEPSKTKPKTKARREDTSVVASNERAKEEPRSETPPHKEASKPQPKTETPPEPKSKPPEKTEDKPPAKQDSNGTAKPAQDQNVQTGTKTGKPGRVKSPYPPHSELDVSGLPSGSLALDPTTQKVFRIP